MVLSTQPVSIVNTKTCATLANTKHPFMLVLERGENLFKALLECAKQVNLKSASIYGLGALDDVSVAYYHLDRKEYDIKLFNGMYELISLQGNITRVDDQPFLHIHAAIGLPDHSVMGGHIMDATVGPTAEITIIPFEASIHRKHSDAIGLKLMCPGF